MSKKKSKNFKSIFFLFIRLFYCFYCLYHNFLISVVLVNSFNKMYFKWVRDLADMAISIFFFKTICLNLWEVRALQNFNLVNGLNDSNDGEKSGNLNIDVFKKSSSDNSNIDEKQNQN